MVFAPQFPIGKTSRAIGSYIRTGQLFITSVSSGHRVLSQSIKLLHICFISLDRLVDQCCHNGSRRLLCGDASLIFNLTSTIPISPIYLCGSYHPLGSGLFFRSQISFTGVLSAAFSWVTGDCYWHYFLSLVRQLRTYRAHRYQQWASWTSPFRLESLFIRINSFPAVTKVVSSPELEKYAFVCKIKTHGQLYIYD